MNDFGHINFLPLNLKAAEVDPDKIKRFMDKRGSRVDYYWTKQINDPWNHVVVRSPNIAPESHEKIGSGWRPDFKKLFPDVVRLVEEFPYDKINYVYLLEQIIEVDPHFDFASKNPNIELEPATYRVTLLMEDTETFYLCNSTESNNRVHPQFPSDTNSWVFSNKNFMHGSILSNKNLRKVLLAVGGDLNIKEHFELLRSSYDKYNRYIL